VLVLDDEATVLGVVARLLESDGHEVYCASSPADAASAARRDAVDLLVIDVRLGDGADGRIAARQILESRPGLPVLFISGGPAELPGLGASRCGLLLKPFRRAELLERLGELVDDAST